MKIDRQQFIAGYPILRIRDLFKRQSNMCQESIQLGMNISSQEAATLIKVLVEEGYLEPILVGKSPAYREEQWWRLQPIGRSLALARAVPAMKREKAERLLKEFLDRVKEVNTSSRFLFKVTRVLAFGSFLRPEVQELNDLDLAVEIRSKFDIKEARDAAEDLCRDQAQEEGRRFSTYSAYLYWPEQMVTLFLKNKSRYISYHSIYDEVLSKTETKQIFPEVQDT